MSLLYNEPPIAISPTLAKEFGLNAAVFLQQLHYWTEEKLRNPDRYRDSWVNGYFWTYNTIDEWLTQLPFIGSKPTFKRMISELQEKGILVVECHNKAGFDKTSWYRINYLRLEQITKSVIHASAQNDPTIGSKRSYGEAQNDLTNTRDYTETTTETTTINTPHTPQGDNAHAKGTLAFVSDEEIKTVVDKHVKAVKKSRSKKGRVFSEDGLPLPKHDPDSFLKWIKIYPKQTYHASAANEWDALKPDSQMVERLIHNITERTQKDADWVKEGGKYIPNPSAYLKGCRWLDKFIEVSVSSGSEGVKVSYHNRAPGQMQSDEEVQAIFEASRKRWEAKQAAQAAMVQHGQDLSEYEGETIYVS